MEMEIFDGHATALDPHHAERRVNWKIGLQVWKCDGLAPCCFR